MPRFSPSLAGVQNLLSVGKIEPNLASPNSALNPFTGRRFGLETVDILIFGRELKSIYHHHHPERKKRKSSEGNCGSIRPYARYGNAGKTSKSISTIAILWPVKAIFEKKAATVEVDTFVSPVWGCGPWCVA